MANNTLKRPQHILQLSSEQQLRFMDSFDRVFSDIDGVIWTLAHNVPHAPDGYAALQRSGKKLSYVTNNSVRTMEQCLRRFQKLGMNVAESDIWHPAKSMALYLQSIKFDGLIYIIATEQFKAVLRQAGFKLIDGPQQLIEESYESLASHIFDAEPVRAVIIDVDFNLSSPKILRAHLYLRHADCQLLLGATDKLLPVAKDVKIIGPGAFAQILVEASGKTPIVMGKPGRPLGKLLLQHYDIPQAQRVLMIGDMLEQDVGFGRDCGFQTLLVLSGGCSLAQLQAETKPELLPDYYADSMADFAQLLRLMPKAHV